MATKTLAPSLRALLAGLIDYAGLYPPAALPLEKTLANYDGYRNGEYAWMLHWLVVGAADLSQVPASLDGSLSVLSDSDIARATSLETKSIVTAPKPAYCEVAVTNLHELDAVKASGNFAKIRMGGVKPEAIPSPDAVAAFIKACADLKLAFKATAGLHHPIRAEYALTYETGAPQAVMHGFLNVLMAAAFAWHGERNIEPIVGETDPGAFSFDERAHWRQKSLDAAQITDARTNFVHSIGSCSFDEPIHDLQSLRLL